MELSGSAADCGSSGTVEDGRLSSTPGEAQVIARFIDGEGVTHQEIEVPDPPPLELDVAYFTMNFRVVDLDIPVDLSIRKMGWELHFILDEMDGGPIAVYRPRKDLL